MHDPPLWRVATASTLALTLTIGRENGSPQNNHNIRRYSIQHNKVDRYKIKVSMKTTKVYTVCNGDQGVLVVHLILFTSAYKEHPLYIFSIAIHAGHPLPIYSCKGQQKCMALCRSFRDTRTSLHLLDITLYKHSSTFIARSAYSAYNNMVEVPYYR